MPGNEKTRDAFIGALLFGSVAIAAALFLIPSGWGPSRFNYYGYYWDALAAGRLWVVESRAGRCPYDLIAYDGHCYLYWGILPAFFHALPGVTDRIVSILAGAVAIFFSLRLFGTLTGPHATGRHRIYAWLFGLGNPLLATVICGWIYAESIAVALAFGLAGLCGFTPLLQRTERYARLTPLVLLALASLSRATWFPVLALATGYSAFRSRGWRRAGMLIPLGGATTLQLALNALRFGHPFEFGVSYYTSHLEGPAGLSWVEGLYSVKAVFWNALSYWFTGFPSEWNLLLRSSLYSEYPLGLFLVWPALALGIRRFSELPPQTKRALVKLGGIVFPLSFFVLFQTTQTWRYETEAWLVFLVWGWIPMVSFPSRSRKETFFRWATLVTGVMLNAWNTYLIVTSRLPQL